MCAMTNPAPSTDTPLKAKKLARDAVQRLADSEPTDDSIEGMERLRGTPQESMFVVSGEELTRVIETTIEDAIYDHQAAPTDTPEGITEAQDLLNLIRLAAMDGYNEKPVSTVDDWVEEAKKRVLLVYLAGRAEASSPAPTDTPELDAIIQRLKPHRYECDCAFCSQWDSARSVLREEYAGLKDENTTLRETLDDWIEKEGAICPEDVGFVEYIDSLEKRVASLRAEVARLTLTEQELDDLDSAIVDATTLVNEEANGKPKTSEQDYIARLEVLRRRISGYTSGGEK